MKLILSFLLTLIAATGFAQIKIHSHNDYTHAKPLLEAVANKVDEIEIDVFLINDSLIVAHSRKDKDLTRTINAMYFNPIANLIKNDAQGIGKTKHSFKLMIDFKDSWNVVYPVLKKEIDKYGKLFDKGKNIKAIQIVISGNRPADSLYHTFPSWVYFDGLPNVNYAKADLKRVTMISDNFATYSKWKGLGEIPEEDSVKLKMVIDKAHKLKKPMRFWGAPDTPDCWKQLVKLGADIINTDKIVECKTFLSGNNGF